MHEKIVPDLFTSEPSDVQTPTKPKYVLDDTIRQWWDEELRKKNGGNDILQPDDQLFPSQKTLQLDPEILKKYQIAPDKIPFNPEGFQIYPKKKYYLTRPLQKEQLSDPAAPAGQPVEEPQSTDGWYRLRGRLYDAHRENAEDRRRLSGNERRKQKQRRIYSGR